MKASGVKIEKLIHETSPSNIYSKGKLSIKFITSFKGSLQLCANGFPFTRHRVLGSTVYWRCVQFKALGCRARLRTRLDKNEQYMTHRNYDDASQKVEIVCLQKKEESSKISQPKKTSNTIEIREGDHDLKLSYDRFGRLIYQKNVFSRVSIGAKNTVRYRCSEYHPKPFIVTPNPASVRTFDGKPLPVGDVQIVKQFNNGHALCLLKRKRLRGYCVHCIKKCKNKNYKQVLDKIETYCPCCKGGPWLCATCFDRFHS
ncbi:CLUMA_CG005554, isoform A [Clunio marinus]|uniref:CLUMA_CG005554, isoform A n=1 Tax=Clunio marinus TaxID=568069 RepID=A0A1J1HV29_9DIPT|nr:CLUMA_CG005554, isoform A [Clunio marinus]